MKVKGKEGTLKVKVVASSQEVANELDEAKKIRIVGGLINRDKYKSVFDFMVSKFPQHKEAMDGIEILITTKGNLDRLGIKYGRGAFYSSIAKCIVVTSNSNTDLLLLHELFHYVSDLDDNLNPWDVKHNEYLAKQMELTYIEEVVLVE
jgi:hypothetical protein